MFQIKSHDSIMASMINRITAMSGELTDFNTGSKVRTILEATASEIDQYYQSLLKGLYEAVPVAVYKTFTFERLPSAASSGYVTFTRISGSAGDIQIPGGTKVKVPNTDYSFTTGTDAAVLLAANNTVDVLVSCLSSGAATNCLANTITEIVDAIPKIASVNNATGFTSGRDEETDSNRKYRFQAWLNTLARSTRDSIQYSASKAKLLNSVGLVTESVKKAIIHEPCIDENPVGPVGYVEVHLWNGVDGASAELITQVKKEIYGYTDETGTKIPGWKAAGVILDVFVVAMNPIPVTAAVTIKSGYAQDVVDGTLKLVVDSYFQGLDVGEKLFWGQLYENMMSVAGVADIALTLPAGNISAPNWKTVNTKGTVTISYIG